MGPLQWQTNLEWKTTLAGTKHYISVPPPTNEAFHYILYCSTTNVIFVAFGYLLWRSWRSRVKTWLRMTHTFMMRQYVLFYHWISWSYLKLFMDSCIIKYSEHLGMTMTIFTPYILTEPHHIGSHFAMITSKIRLY